MGGVISAQQTKHGIFLIDLVSLLIQRKGNTWMITFIHVKINKSDGQKCDTNNNLNTGYLLSISTLLTFSS